jgi:hypothetical protein
VRQGAGKSLSRARFSVIPRLPSRQSRTGRQSDRTEQPTRRTARAIGGKELQVRQDPSAPSGPAGKELQVRQDPSAPSGPAGKELQVRQDPSAPSGLAEPPALSKS